MPEQASGGASHLPDQDPSQSAPEDHQRAATAGDPPDIGHGVLTAGSESSGLDSGQSNEHPLADHGAGPQSKARNFDDPRYLSWRDEQLEKLDAEYQEFRRERQDRFDAEFDSWRQSRPPQQSAGPEASNQGELPVGS